MVGMLDNQGGLALAAAGQGCDASGTMADAGATAELTFRRVAGQLQLGGEALQVLPDGASPIAPLAEESAQVTVGLGLKGSERDDRLEFPEGAFQVALVVQDHAQAAMSRT